MVHGASSSSPYCSVCHANYRGSYAVHTTTGRHRRNVAGGPLTKRKRAAARRAMARASSKSLGSWHLRHWNDQGADMVSVVKHRRRPPDDGPRHIVQVRHYWRQPPGGTRF